ncbi:MAG: hypothetical protein ACU843_17860 [Gammaproteobacteria bacterium]
MKELREWVKKGSTGSKSRPFRQKLQGWTHFRAILTDFPGRKQLTRAVKRINPIRVNFRPILLSLHLGDIPASFLLRFEDSRPRDCSHSKQNRNIPERSKMNRTFLWWKFLCFMAVINILVWLVAIGMRSDFQNFSFSQPVLSGVYVLVCAFRSFFPRIDLERYCLFDTPISSVVIGRSCATVAEICFSIQCALLIYDLGVLLNAPTIISISYAIVPIIVLAQISCWYAALTLNHFWHGMEEFAWVVMVLLAAGCFLNGFILLSGFNQVLMGIGLLSGLGSIYIMLFFDIPMYFSRKQDGSRSGMKYLTITEGMNDALSRRVQTSDWEVWKKEALWITPYFTVGVWLSIGMALINFHA